MIVYRLNYKTIAASEANKLIKTDKNLVILDVRKPSEFEGKDTIEELNIGRLKKAINLPLEKIKSSPSELDKYKGKTILVYDNYGEESNKAAAIIASRETSNVYNLFGGMSAMMGREKDNRKLINELVEGLPPYKLLSVKETADLLAKNDKLVIIDVRSNEEYNNNGKQRWKNLGRIKEAKNFPSAELEKRLNELENYKNASVLLYGNSAAKCGRLLYEAGFKNVNIVYDGIWGLVSTIKNVDGLQHLQTFLENNEGLY